jgi:hypothetical protein
MPGALNSRNRKHPQERIVVECVDNVYEHLLASLRVLERSFNTTVLRRCLPTSCVVVVRLAAHGLIDFWHYGKQVLVVSSFAGAGTYHGKDRVTVVIRVGTPAPATV